AAGLRCSETRGSEKNRSPNGRFGSPNSRFGSTHGRFGSTHGRFGPSRTPRIVTVGAGFVGIATEPAFFP
ncbi:MAG TPA: hypothetical protein VGI44_13505, partial [Acidimicrobiales bacterium]